MMKLGETWSQLHLGVHLSLQKAKAAYRDTYEKVLDPAVAEEMEAVVWKIILKWAIQKLEDVIEGGSFYYHSSYQRLIYFDIVSSNDVNELVASVLLEVLIPYHYHSGTLPCKLFDDDEFWLEYEGGSSSSSWREKYDIIKPVCRRCSLIYMLNQSCRRSKDARRLARRRDRNGLNYIAYLASKVEPGKIPDIARNIDQSHYVQSFRKLTNTERHIIEKHIYKSVFLLLFYFRNLNIVAMLTDGESLELGILYFLIRKVIPIPLRKEYIQNGYLYNYCNETSQWRVKRRIQKAYRPRQHCLLCERRCCWSFRCVDRRYCIFHKYI
jgi:hypothetical protein